MKKAFLVIILVLLHISLFAQEEQEEKEPKLPLKDRIFFGGSFGLSFGDVTFIDFSPVVGYKITPRFSAGAGIVYQYANFKRVDYSSNTFGGRAFGIAKIFDPVFAQLEYEYLSYEIPVIPEGKTRANFSSVLGGGGVSQPLSKNVFFNFTALYNFTYNLNTAEYKPYDSPWVIRGGLTIGF